MSTFQELMACIGIGAATATLKVAEAYQCRGSFADVELTLHGGNVPQRIESLSVSLVRHYDQGRYRKTETLTTQTLDTQFDVVPNDRHVYTAQIAIPDDAPLGGVSWSDYLVIAADADIVVAVNPRAHVRLNVTYHREFFAIENAMERLGFPAQGNIGTTFLSGDQIVMKFAPKYGLADQIDGVALYLDLYDTYIRGSMKLNYVEKSAKDLLKAAVGMNSQEIPISFSRSKLLTPNGKLNPEGAMPILEKALADSLILPDNEAHWMLRASQAPARGKEELLRPASDFGSTRPAELLRPMEGDEVSKE